MTDLRTEARERTYEMVRDLRVRYPRLIRGSVPLGIWFGPGWCRLIDSWFLTIDLLLDDMQATDFTLRQIKEKWGQLRLVYSVNDRGSSQGESSDLQALFLRSQIDEAKIAAQTASLRTCYFCGAEGQMRQSNWVRVTCAQCESSLRQGRELLRPY